MSEARGGDRGKGERPRGKAKRRRGGRGYTKCTAPCLLGCDVLHESILLVPLAHAHNLVHLT